MLYLGTKDILFLKYHIYSGCWTMVLTWSPAERTLWEVCWGNHTFKHQPCNQLKLSTNTVMLMNQTNCQLRESGVLGSKLVFRDHYLLSQNPEDLKVIAFLVQLASLSFYFWKVSTALDQTYLIEWENPFAPVEILSCDSTSHFPQIARVHGQQTMPKINDHSLGLGWEENRRRRCQDRIINLPPAATSGSPLLKSRQRGLSN